LDEVRNDFRDTAGAAGRPAPWDDARAEPGIGANWSYPNFRTGSIYLATQSDGDFAGYTAAVTGWNVFNEGSSNPPVIPYPVQVAEMTVLTNSDLAQTWGPVIGDGHVGLSDPNASACLGDGGDPIVGSGVLLGIVSWGSVTCNPAFPTVATRISYYRDWIITQ
jgi:hypothetical protein